VPVVWEFGKLVDADVEELLTELAFTHSELATLHEEIAFTRSSEQSHPELKPQRYMDEGRRDALVEKKFLILRLLDIRSIDLRSPDLRSPGSSDARRAR
jgi:hypothetical protein